jgi:hypothetical protein
MKGMNVCLVVAWLAAVAGPAGDRRAAAQATGSTGSTETTAVRVEDVCERYYRSLLTAYRTDRARHLRVTAGYLRMVRALRIEELAVCEARLARYVTTNGAGPYLGAVSEHAHRLTRFSDPLLERRVTLLGAAVVPALRRESASPATASARVALIRAYRDEGYMAVSENAARAVVGLQLSPAGQALAGAGGTPEALLRSIQTYRDCKETVLVRPADAAERHAHANCLALIHELQRLSPDGNTGFLGMAEAASLVAPGVWKAQDPCIVRPHDTTTLPGATEKAIDELEEKLACEQAHAGVRRDSRLLPSGLMEGDGDHGNNGDGNDDDGNDDYAPHEDGPQALREKLKGFTLADKKVDELPGGRGMQHTYTYTDDRDPKHTIVVSMYSVPTGDSWADSETEVGTVVIESTEHGIATEAYDAAETPVAEEIAGTGVNLGSDQQRYYEGGRLRAEVIHENDEYTVINYDAQGKETKRTVYDQYGNCLSNCGPDRAGAITPPDDSEVFPCAHDWTGDLLGKPEPVDPLAPDPSIILPSPESVDAGVSNACLETVVGTRRPACEPSVAQCMDPWFVNDRCECVPGGDAPEVDQTSPNCFFVDCGDAATCDPATGLCQTSNSGLEFPGTIPPPPFR